MSEPLQSGYHPDADQICAFVEHVLPAHEREQMLDHLAVCSECRAAVALSLPPIEEPLQAPAGSRLKPWWLGWRIAWPASVAAATVVLSVFYIHRASVAPKTAIPAQIAEGRPAAPPVAARQSPVPAAKQPVRSAPIQSVVTSRSTSNFKTGVEAPRKAETVANTEHNGAIQIQSQNSVVLDKLSQPAPMPSAGPFGQGAGMGAGSGGSLRTNVGNAPAAVAGAPLQRTASAQQAEKPGASSTVPRDTAITGRSTQALTVVGAAPGIQTESIDASSLALTEDEAQVTQFIRLKHPLPSGLPALSAAMQARRIVAIDAQNGIFLSKDGGKHWKAIHPQWQGRAVRVERVDFAAASNADLEPRKASERTGLKPVGAAPAPNATPPPMAAGSSLAATSGASLAGTVTDVTGAVIPRTSVSVIDSATHTAHTVTTDDIGHYLVDGLAPGSYTVEANAPGFVNQSVADVAVLANHQNVANLSLKVGEVTEAVTVNATSIESATETSAQRTSIKAKKRAASDVSTMPSPVFAITTDNGERWSSADGVTWKRP
ncbi:MAG: carboxypeptidase regulatory-like domain-containing protein [Terracidiphilus sp.]